MLCHRDGKPEQLGSDVESFPANTPHSRRGLANFASRYAELPINLAGTLSASFSTNHLYRGGVRLYAREPKVEDSDCARPRFYEPLHYFPYSIPWQRLSRYPFPEHDGEPS